MGRLVLHSSADAYVLSISVLAGSLDFGELMYAFKLEMYTPCAVSFWGYIFGYGLCTCELHIVGMHIKESWVCHVCRWPVE